MLHREAGSRVGVGSDLASVTPMQFDWLWVDRVWRKRNGSTPPTPEELGKAMLEIKEAIEKLAREVERVH